MRPAVSLVRISLPLPCGQIGGVFMAYTEPCPAPWVAERLRLTLEERKRPENYGYAIILKAPRGQESAGRELRERAYPKSGDKISEGQGGGGSRGCRLRGEMVPCASAY